MIEVLIIEQGGSKFAIFTSKIILLETKENQEGTYIHVYDMEESFYTKMSIEALLNTISARY